MEYNSSEIVNNVYYYFYMNNNIKVNSNYKVLLEL